MKIGEFAKRCNTQISVVRHYDKLKLLSPVHIDNFTGYRYYSEAQIAVFSRIRDLKEAGFTLGEIKTILYSHESENVRQIVDRNQARLLKMFQNLETIKQNLSGGVVVEQQYKPFIENIDFSFVNDEQVIGRWSVLPDDSGINPSDIQIGSRTHEIYFSLKTVFAHLFTKIRSLAEKHCRLGPRVMYSVNGTALPVHMRFGNTEIRNI